MSPEEIERTVQFLLHQQAQFAADFERLSAKTDRIADGLIGLTGIVGNLTGNVGHLTAHIGLVTDRLGDVTDRLGDVTDRLGNVTDRLAELAAAQERTDQQIRNMQEMFERHLREDHGERPN
jgi:ABC-type transporter Mla subunit MlaD